MKWIKWVVAIATVGIGLEPLRALTLDEYLNQVRKQNPAAVASEMMQSSGLQTLHDKDLLLAPTLIFNAQYKNDKAPPFSPGITYDSQDTFGGLLGVRKLTTFGLTAEVDFEYDTLKIQGQQYTGFPNSTDAQLYQARPVITLTQSLWGNGFGRGTRATYTLLDAQGLQKSLNGQFQKEALMVEAEGTYWRLVNVREQIQILTQAVEQAERIFTWNQNRRVYELNESSDVLQAKAAFQARTLDLQSARDQERELAEKFNTLRHIEANEVSDKLEDIPDLKLLAKTVPERTRMRTDVKVAEQMARVSAASAVSSAEKDKPVLDVSVGYALTGIDSSQSSSAFNSIKKPTTTVGVKFLMPLDFNAMKMARQGYAAEQSAAETTYQQKVFEEQRDWQNLAKKLTEAQRRYQILSMIEETQKAKIENEKARFKNGRTTTYQVLMFEQDHLLSQINRVRTELELLSLMSQMKLYR